MLCGGVVTECLIGRYSAATAIDLSWLGELKPARTENVSGGQNRSVAIAKKRQ
jgi:hypothetical protein